MTTKQLGLAPGLMAVLIWLLAHTAAGAIIPSFTRIGQLPNGYTSEANAISRDGTTVVGTTYYYGDGTAQAFRWTKAGGLKAMGWLGNGAAVSLAHAVSANGSVIVGASSTAQNPSFSQPFRWTVSSGMVGLGFSGEANDTSADGSVVVGSTSNSGFRWTQSGGTNLIGNLPTGSHSVANGVSANGITLVGLSNKGLSGIDRYAISWTAATGLQVLGDLPHISPDPYSEAKAISADGTTIVGASYSGDGIEATTWKSSAAAIGLGDLPGDYLDSTAYAVSGDGSIIVGQGDAGRNLPSAFIWDAAHGMRNLQDLLVQKGLGAQLNGWILIRATGISDDGQTISGWGYGPTGTEAWVATLPVPEPSTFALAIAGVLGFVLCKGPDLLNRASQRPAIASKSIGQAAVR